MSGNLRIGDRTVGRGSPILLVAELSANHQGSLERTIALVHAARRAGADAVKLQTYTADTLTLDSDSPSFRPGADSLWAGRTLYDLYREAEMPWEWQPRLKEISEQLGLIFFSTAFDLTALAFLEKLGVPAHKIASFELVDLPLVRAAAATGKPLILSTGMGTRQEIAEAVDAARSGGGREIALLKCTSAYPASPEDMNLRTIVHLRDAFNLPVGVSDHTLGIAVPVAAAALGASIIEKHFTLSRADGGPDAAFSLEPDEFEAMVAAVRTTEAALGEVRYGPVAHERESLRFRRSLFVVADVRQGEPFTPANVRSIRPNDGLHPRHLAEVLGRRAARDICRGTPLSWDLVS